jgi:transcriptional regulator with XRE-family HTH domain
MTPEDFKAWRKAMGWTQTEAAIELGISRGSVELYERGSRREDGRPVEIPRTVALACAALTHGLEPWPNKRPAS